MYHLVGSSQWWHCQNHTTWFPLLSWAANSQPACDQHHTYQLHTTTSITLRYEEMDDQNFYPQHIHHPHPSYPSRAVLITQFTIMVHGAQNKYLKIICQIVTLLDCQWPPLKLYSKFVLPNYTMFSHRVKQVGIWPVTEQHFELRVNDHKRVVRCDIDTVEITSKGIDIIVPEYINSYYFQH